MEYEAEQLAPHRDRRRAHLYITFHIFRCQSIVRAAGCRLPAQSVSCISCTSIRADVAKLGEATSSTSQ